MNARDELISALEEHACCFSPEDAAQMVDAFAHELADRLRNVHATDEGAAWNWWDAAEIPAACADLIDPHKQHAKEPTP